MISEEHEILRSTIREFVQKTLEPDSLEMERKGVSEETRKSIAAQGFLGATVSSSLGGSELDGTGYLILLDEIARASPSVSAGIMLLNSLFYPLAADSDEGKMAVKEAISTGSGGSVVLNTILDGYRDEGEIKLVNGTASGKRDHVLNRNSSAAIMVGANDSLILVKDSSAFTAAEYSLGFRGIGMTCIEMENTPFVMLKETGGKEAMERVLDSSDLAVSAIALGLVSGCLEKGIDYTKVRKTFGQSLSAYQPVAFTLSTLRAEESILRKSLYSGDLDEKEKLMVKVRAIELSKRASKYALQVHGGYGYLEDFGVEKFYRDSTALANMFGRSVRDMERLSEHVYGEKTGFL